MLLTIRKPLYLLFALVIWDVLKCKKNNYDLWLKSVMDHYSTVWHVCLLVSRAEHVLAYFCMYQELSGYGLYQELSVSARVCSYGELGKFLHLLACIKGY